MEITHDFQKFDEVKIVRQYADSHSVNHHGSTGKITEVSSFMCRVQTGEGNIANWESIHDLRLIKKAFIET